MSTVRIRYSRDGGRNYSDWRERSLGEVGEFMKKVEVSRLGQGTDWVFEIAISDPVRADLMAASVQIEGEA